MKFGSPWLLLGLLLLVLVVLAYVYRGPAAQPVRRALHEPRRARERRRVDELVARHVPLALFLLALTALLVGVARPNMMREVNQPVATVILVIDTSGSMFAEDVRPTRLEAAQKVVRDFVLDLPERYRVGVVAFSGQAELVAPVTDDHAIAVESIDYLFPQRGTAIGDALARAVQVGRAATATAPPDERAISDRPPLRRHADRRAARAARRRTAGALVPDPGLHGRARHARGRDRAIALGRAAHHPRAARPGHAPPDRRRHEAGSTSRPRAPIVSRSRTSAWARSSARPRSGRR